MATIIELARNIAATMSPATGVRATGTARVVRLAGETEEGFIPNGIFALAQVGGVVRQNLVFRVCGGTDEFVLETSNTRAKNKTITGWKVPAGGSTDVQFTSIVGGERHNIGFSQLVFDPGVPGFETVIDCVDGFDDGEDPIHFGGIKGVALFETMSGPSINLDLFRSEMGGEFPAVIIVWNNTQPADGTSTADTNVGARTAGTTVQYKETYDLMVVASREDSDHFRRSEGLQILDDISGLLADRKSVDGCPFSNPSGLQIKGRQRILGNQEFYQDFYIYNLQITARTSIVQVDDREFATWCLARMTFEGCDDVERGQDRIKVAGPIEVDLCPFEGVSNGSSVVSGELTVS